MSVGDVLGWLGVITLFALFVVTIRFIWLRALPPKTSDDSFISYAKERIAKLDAKVRKLLAERSEWKRLMHDHMRLREELENKGIVEATPVTPLLAAIGSDAMLKLDEAALRAVRTETGMEFERIRDATLPAIKRRLDRERGYGRPFDKLHLAVHSAPDGIILSGQLVDAAALSEILDGVQVLLVAGCESSQIGDALGVVPYVITMNEAVGNADAAQFTKVFWTQIGKRKKPAEALRKALELAPSGMSEYVERHF